MTTPLPLDPAAKARTIVFAILGGVLSLVGVLAPTFLSAVVEPCTTQAECIAATTALLGPTLALTVGPVLLFLVGGIVALVRRILGRRDFWIALAVTVVLQALWIVGWIVVTALA